jgi:tetratricopeptide (TPR) repeat protein
MMKLAVALKEQGRNAETEKLFRRTLEARCRVLGEEHHLTLGPAIGLAEALYALGDLDEAERIFRETIEVAPDRYMAYLLVRLGEVLIDNGNAAEAKHILDEGLQLQRESLPGDHSDLAASQCVLGKCLTALGRYDEAEPLLLDGYDRLKAIQGESGYETRRALRCVIKLYASWHTAEPDKGYDAKAADWRAKLSK